MRYLFAFLAYFVVGSCTRAAWHAPLALPPMADTVMLPSSSWGGGKIKARTVIIQAGTGNVATASDNTKAGQRGGAAATAPGATATATTHKAPPAWVYLLVIGVGIAAWEYLSRCLPAAWLPWRVRPG